MDSAFFGSVEFEADIPGIADNPSPFKNLNWGDILHVSFFTDYAHGNLHSPNAGDEASISVGGFGLGLNFSLPGEFTTRVQVAHPTNTDRQPSDRDLSHWWFDFTYSF